VIEKEFPHFLFYFCF